MKHSFNKVAFVVSTAIIGVAMTSAVSAAERQFLHSNNAELAVKSQQDSSLMATSAAQFVGLSADSELQTRKTYLDSDGSVTVRYQQMYKGIPVIGDDVVISRHADGSFKRAHGAFVAGIEADIASTKPALSNKIALRNAKLLNAPAGIGFSKIDSSSAKFENESSRLAIWLSEEGTAKLAYEVSFVKHDENGPSRPYIVMDAQTGEVLEQRENLQTASATGPGGNQKTGQYFYGTQFGSMDVAQSGSTCTMNNTNVKTVNLNHGTSGSTAYSFTCPENTFKAINGAYAPLNDAHYFGGVIFNMYQDWIGIAPLSFQLTMKVHYSSNYENAFWDGSAMSFGDGASTFYPLVSLDVSAHEVSHGVTEQNSGLVYSGQSGGLNEAFSDMAGEAAESYMNGSNDWQVGAQIFKGNGALRYMNNPPQDGSSIDNAADFTSSMDVHYSSGVYNKAFYKLATTAGWTTQKAFQVYTKANRNYWTSNVNWNQAGNGVLDAACDLGFNTDDVQASLVSVGVSSSLSSGSSCSTTPPPPPPPPGNLVLTNGVPVTGLSASTGSDIVYTMAVPAGATDIKFAMSGGSGDADMYVKFGSTPTDSSYDCRPYASGNTENCTGTQSGGTYYVRVKAYSAFSGVSLTGSYTGSTPPTGNDPIDSTINNISVSRRAWKHYTLDLASGYSSLTVTMSGGSGDADLYVKHGAQSTSSSYDCRPYKSGNNEVCTFNAPASGTWYIDLYGYSSASGVTLNVKANP